MKTGRDSRFSTVPLASALRGLFSRGYSLSEFRSDLLAGIVVALVAIPLGMALAISTGVKPENGLYTIIVGGAVIAALGGSRLQVSGPTAAFVPVLVPIVTSYGFSGLLTAGMMAGVILILMGVFRFGQLIQFIPYPVTMGFTSGISVVIASIQLKDFFGLNFESVNGFLPRIIATIQAMPTLKLPELAVGMATLFLLILFSKTVKRVPAPLLAFAVVTPAVFAVNHFLSLGVETIGSRFSTSESSGIPSGFPPFTLPWQLLLGTEEAWWTHLETFERLIPSAFAIALLGAIESLLSAVIADGMTQERHDPDAELIAVGVGNLLCPFFAAIPATGAIARTATNIRYGARSPIAAILHAGVTLLVVLFLASVVSAIPMAALSALLLVVAWSIAEARHFAHVMRVAARSDAAVLAFCFVLTVLFDMVIGVAAGVILSALLFIRRMSEITGVQLIASSGAPDSDVSLPPGAILYDIDGPLFFGAAYRAMDTIGNIQFPVHTIILNFRNVPVMDMTGLVALESTVKKMIGRNCDVVLCEVRPKTRALLDRSTVLKEAARLSIVPTVADALRRLSHAS